MGASRASVMLALSRTTAVCQTGKVVAPTLYVAVVISGATSTSRA